MQSAGRRMIEVTLAALAALTVALPAGGAPDGDLLVTFGYALADFTGRIPFGDAPLALDSRSGEVLVAQGRDVRVFNEYGMQVFRIRSSYALATVIDLAVEPDGHVIALARDLDAPGDRPRVAITRYDFRGAPAGEIEITGAPPPFDNLLPNRVFSEPEGLLFANTNRMLAVLVDREGQYRRGYDLCRILGVAEDDRDNVEISGIDVDADGNIFLTSAVLFRAFELSSDGTLKASWGKPGSARGTFGVVAGIAWDPQGRIYVVDKNRGVLMIFGEDHKLLAEVGGDPDQRRTLGRPSRVLADGHGRVYVTQIGTRGVWVYEIRQR